MSRSLRALLVAALGAGALAAAGVPLVVADDAPPDEQLVVSHVIDGDTIRVSDDHGRPLGRVRLVGLDAPEMARDERPAECGAVEARQRLAELLPVGSAVTARVVPGEPDRDRYERMLRRVEVDGVDIGQQLVADGAARSSPTFGSPDRYRGAQESARNEPTGLWSQCGPHEGEQHEP